MQIKLRGNRFKASVAYSALIIVVISCSSGNLYNIYDVSGFGSGAGHWWRIKDEVGIINSAIFNAGFLTGGSYFDYRLTDPEREEDKPLYRWREKFFAVCGKHEIAPGDACLKFALSAPQVTAVALNPSKPHRMANNKVVLDKEFPKAFWEDLKSEKIIDAEYPYVYNLLETF